jgi:CHAD domain-containing protein
LTCGYGNRMGLNSGARSLATYLCQQRDAIRQTDPGVRSGDPDAVHDMRVAIRRLRATLRTARPLLDRVRTEPLRDELHWLGGVLGGVRDGDVLSQRLTEAVHAEPPELVMGPVAARIQQQLAADTAKARTELSAAMDSPRYVALLDALDALVDSTPARVSARRLRRLAGKALRRADRQLDAADHGDDAAVLVPLPSTGDRDIALHEARKSYKRARYAVEVLKPLAGKPARGLAKRLTVLQDTLGAHQDAVVASQLLHDYGIKAHQEGENAFAYGLLHARQRDAGEARLADLDRVRRRAGKKRLRRWLS